MRNRLSLELRLLVLSIRVSFQGEERELFKESLLDSSLNWERVHLLIKYHQIIPVFYDACKQVSFRNRYIAKYEIFSKRQAITNIQYEQEYLRIAEAFSRKSIRVVPYKGVLFLKELYRDKSLRQMSDLDILVHERDAIQALEILVNEGYSFKEKVDIDNLFLERLIADIPNKEISLFKSSAGGNTVWLDFHWHLNAFKGDELDIDKLLNNVEKQEWGGRFIAIPAKASIFIMLLNHHAARDCWVRLKYICDLWMFLKKHSDLSISDLEKQAADTHMLRVLRVGLQLLNDFLDEECHFFNTEEKNKQNKIIEMWETGMYWDYLLPKIRLLVLYKNFQDGKLTWMDIIREQIEFHSKRGFNRPKRLIEFPDNYKLLNAISKLGGYFLDRIRAD